MVTLPDLETRHVRAVNAQFLARQSLFDPLLGHVILRGIVVASAIGHGYSLRESRRRIARNTAATALESVSQRAASTAEIEAFVKSGQQPSLNIRTSICKIGADLSWK